MSEISSEIKRAKLHDWYLDTSAGRYECRDCPAVAVTLEGQEAADELGCPGDDLGEQAADPNEHPTGAPCSDPWCADKGGGDRD